MTTPDGLKARAAELRVAAADATDCADEAAITADLLDARPAALSALAAAEAEAAELRKIADHARDRLGDLEDDITEMHRRYAVSAALVGGDDMTARVEARIACIGIGDELDALATRVEPAKQAAAETAVLAGQAAAAESLARSELTAITEALLDPLRHERARLCASWQARAARGWVAVLSDTAKFDRHYRAVALRMLDRVLATDAGKQAAVEAANHQRAMAAVEGKHLRRLEDGNLRFEQVSTLTGADPGLPDAGGARAAAAANSALIQDLSLAEPVRRG
jgi:hypothetical protein